MLLGDFARLIRRHWIIAAVGLILALSSAAGAALTVPPTYQARATVLLVPSTSVPGVDRPVNPFQNYGSYTAVAGSVLAIQTQGASSVAAIVSQGGVDTFTVEANPNASGAAIDITVKAAGAAQALKTVDLVTTQMSSLLTDLQDKVKAPAGTFLSMQPLTKDPAATALYKSAVQSAILALVLVLIIAMVVLVLTDRLTNRNGPDDPDADSGTEAAGTTEPATRSESRRSVRIRSTGRPAGSKPRSTHPVTF